MDLMKITHDDDTVNKLYALLTLLSKVNYIRHKEFPIKSNILDIVLYCLVYRNI